jgi:polysaccharide deacetylase family protein (PEP-CTERM system associated)
LALSFDLEFWWCSEFLKNTELTTPQPIIQDATDMVLGLLDKHEQKATFFVLGEVAEKFPATIDKIQQSGHEIGAHGYAHKNVFSLSPHDFEEDLKKVTQTLSSITSAQPVGYRAPNFSITESSNWMYEILQRYGYRYSSSIFPFKTKLYGLPRAPLAPYSPSPDDILQPDPDGTFLEFPATVLKFPGRNIPVSGGFYFRLLPARVTKFALNKVTHTRPAVFFLHLRDIYPSLPRLKSIPISARIFHYTGLRRALLKFEYLLQNLSFQRIQDVLGLT